MQGIGFDQDTMLAAGIEHAQAFAAVSSGDNSNIVAARVAREKFGVDRVVARIYDPRRAAIYARLGIPTVATVAWTTKQMMPAPASGDPEPRDCGATTPGLPCYTGSTWNAAGTAITPRT